MDKQCKWFKVKRECTDEIPNKIARLENDVTKLLPPGRNSLLWGESNRKEDKNPSSAISLGTPNMELLWQTQSQRRTKAPILFGVTCFRHLK